MKKTAEPVTVCLPSYVHDLVIGTWTTSSYKLGPATGTYLFTFSRGEPVTLTLTKDGLANDDRNAIWFSKSFGELPAEHEIEGIVGDAVREALTRWRAPLVREMMNVVGEEMDRESLEDAITGIVACALEKLFPDDKCPPGLDVTEHAELAASEAASAVVTYLRDEVGRFCRK